MSTEEVTSRVEAIEAKAEKVLKDAQERASEILRKASDEVISISSAKISLDEVKAECQGIVGQAKKQAEKEGWESQKKAAEIKVATTEKVDGITKRIVHIVSGAGTR